MRKSQRRNISLVCEIRHLSNAPVNISGWKRGARRTIITLPHPGKSLFHGSFISSQKSLTPALPSELALSFFVQGYKLIFAVYHIVSDGKGASKFNRYSAECLIPWINEALLLLTVGLQTAQQLKDKVRKLVV